MSIDQLLRYIIRAPRNPRRHSWARIYCSVLAAISLQSSLLFGQQGSVETSAAEGLWQRHEVYQGAACMTAVAGDFTGDGRVDIVCNAGNKTRLLVAPEWNEVLLGDDEQHNFIHSEVLDVDADGDLDYIGARYNPGLIVWFEHPDAPLDDVWKVHLISDQVHGIHGLLTGDVNLDGQVDLLATSAQPKPPFPESLVWLEVPQNPRDAQDWPIHVLADRDAPGLTHYLGMGDVNGDGRPDVATGAKGGPQDESASGEWFAWWEAAEDPNQVWTKRVLSSSQPGATNIHPTDVNGDGQLDFVASRGHGQGVIWFEAPNWKEHVVDSSIREPHCLVVVDLDRDGDQDAATCAFGDKVAAWYENDSRGNFSKHVVGLNQEAYDIRAVDLDQDRDLDLLVAGRGSNNVVWYENPIK